MKIMPYISLSYFMGAWALPRCRACCHPDPPVARHFGSGVRRHLHGACGGAGTNCRHVAWGQKGHVGGGCKPYETWSIAMNKSTVHFHCNEMFTLHLMRYAFQMQVLNSVVYWLHTFRLKSSTNTFVWVAKQIHARGWWTSMYLSSIKWNLLETPYFLLQVHNVLNG